ncbi:phage tail tape measure protein [Streptomyces sp. NPDC057235]|uniref:phage tail tape measure protein n=1 Tax=Streptomyces sp. NPDC057235 TaxID=3346058 RepID=UPI00362D9A57
MTVLDELLVDIGIDADDLADGTGQASAEVERALNGVADAADAMGRDIAHAADRAADAVEDIGASAEEASAGAQDAADNVEGSLGGIQAAAAGALVGGLFMAGLTQAMDAKAANAKLAIQFNLTEAEAERAGKLAGDVYAAGFSDSMEGVSDALGAVSQAMGGMGKVGDEELSSMTKSAIMLAETFEYDVGEASTAAGQLIKQGLVRDGEDAFDVLTRASQILPKSMLADIPTIVSEYGIHFKRIGIDAKTAFGMMAQYVQAGGKDIDQAGDVLHEFARITSEETDRAAEGFKGLGLDSKAMLKAIGQGGPAAAQALSTTITALRSVKDPAKQAELGVQLFGDMAGEGAAALWAMDPASAAAVSGMDDAAGAARDATDAMAESQSMEASWRQISTTLGEILAPALAAVAGWLSEHQELIKVLAPGLIAGAVALGIVAIATWVWNAALLASPVTWIILGILALIAVIALIIIKWDEISAATSRVWGEITDSLGEAWDWCVDAAADWWHNTTEPWISGWDWLYRYVFGPIGRFFTETLPRWFNDGTAAVEKTWDDTVGWFGALPGRLASIGSGLWSWITDGLKDALNGAIYLVNMGIWSINNSLISQVNRLPGVEIGFIPYIPMLAEGGITTGPTLAMIGEGAEQEAVLPLSRLDGMLSAAARPVVQVGGADREQRLVLDVRGSAEDDFVRWFKSLVDNKGGGSVIRLAEG